MKPLNYNFHQHLKMGLLLLIFVINKFVSHKTNQYEKNY